MGSRPSATKRGSDRPPYAYLIYPHKPIVAYVPQTSRLLGEYCVEFPDRERPYGSSRLPPSDDVLAKWLALTADERALIASANLHLAGRQHDPDALRSDLAALGRWERARIAQRARDAGVSAADPRRPLGRDADRRRAAPASRRLTVRGVRGPAARTASPARDSVRPR